MKRQSALSGIIKKSHWPKKPIYHRIAVAFAPIFETRVCNPHTLKTRALARTSEILSNQKR
jgi:hypothetical protein